MRQPGRCLRTGASTTDIGACGKINALMISFRAITGGEPSNSACRVTVANLTEDPES